MGEKRPLKQEVYPLLLHNRNKKCVCELCVYDCAVCASEYMLVNVYACVDV
jgi:hypothetical protein